MTVRKARPAHREVAPLELFFDLVFVLAIGQLTHHLIEHLTWRGAAETLVMLVAVCGVWAFTSFEVTLLDIERRGTKAITVTVMGLGLFMNAGITHAFDTSPWLLVIPMLLSLAGPASYAMATAPTPHLRQHFLRVLIWVAVSAPFWITGAALEPDYRIWCWAAAAFIDLLGTWTAHPAPGRATRTARLPFDTEHMLERMRLFLIILLGETVLTLGRVISEHHADALTLLMALGGFVALVCLWIVYFGRAEQAVVRHTAATDDPIRSVHLGINVIYGVVAGLVTLAAGLEIVLAHAHDGSGAAGVLVLVGPLVYLLSQAIYFGVETGTGWLPRVIGAALLGVAAATAYWLPAYAVVALLVVILLALAVHLSRDTTDPQSPQHPDPTQRSPRPVAARPTSDGFCTTNTMAKTGPGDVVVVFSVWQTCDSTVRATEIAAAAKAHIVVITDDETSPVARLANKLITVPVDGGPRSHSPGSSTPTPTLKTLFSPTVGPQPRGGERQ